MPCQGGLGQKPKTVLVANARSLHPVQFPCLDQGLIAMTKP